MKRSKVGQTTAIDRTSPVSGLVLQQPVQGGGLDRFLQQLVEVAGHLPVAGQGLGRSQGPDLAQPGRAHQG